ncbi:hypothetical protein BJ165DRAFT_1533978 [Panaeolus papilionaceus]|nr:hypothetical protein BJ165DRAFT_1533978 [Panaeolus papilionaceus]
MAAVIFSAYSEGSTILDILPPDLFLELRHMCVWSIGKLEAIERKVTLQWGYGLQILPSTKEKPADVEEIKEAVPEPVTSSSPTVDSKEDHPASPATTAVPAVATPPKSLSLVSIILKLAKSSRMLMPLSIVFMHGSPQFRSIFKVYGGSTRPKLDWYLLQQFFRPSFLRRRTWWILLILEVHLTLFILSFAVQSFFILSILASVTAELASVANSIEDVGYAHVYSAFNLIYGIGTTVGTASSPLMQYTPQQSTNNSPSPTPHKGPRHASSLDTRMSFSDLARQINGHHRLDR